MLTIQGLTKRYGSHTILQDINLNFLPGKVYGIVGANGAGKTTLFKCIAGMETHGGKITSPYPILKNHIGYLETDPQFLSFITGWEYLKLMCISRGLKTENFEEQNVFDLPLDQYAETYSTGMKKKLALTGVLLRKSDILILDEPFNGVDIASNMIITGLIKELRDLNKTILLSSHIFSTISETCDEIIHLSNGQANIIEDKKDFKGLENRMKNDFLNQAIKRINLT